MNVALVVTWRVKLNSSYIISASSGYTTTEVVDQCHCAIDGSVGSSSSGSSSYADDRLTFDVDV